MTPPTHQLPSSFKRLVLYWLPVMVLCLAIFVQSAYPPSETLDRWLFSDKLAHALVYGLLALLIIRALNTHARWQGRPLASWGIAVMAAVFYGLGDEWHQSFVSTRTADALDLLADGVGAVLGAGVYGWFSVIGIRCSVDDPK